MEIVETKKLELQKTASLIGFPDTGLVGAISVSHIIESLKLEEIGYIESEQLPPIIAVHQKRPKPLIKIYGSSIICAVSEVPIPLRLINPLSETLAEWFKSKEVGIAISIGGLIQPKRLEIEEPKVYGIPSSEETEKILEKQEIKIFEEGLLAGPNAMILLKCAEKSVPALYLMAESHYGFPDPGAAASVIVALNKMLGTNVDVKPLLEKGEEIRLNARSLMKETEEALKSVQKSHEEAMYR